MRRGRGSACPLSRLGASRLDVDSSSPPLASIGVIKAHTTLLFQLIPAGTSTYRRGGSLSRRGNPDADSADPTAHCVTSEPVAMISGPALTTDLTCQLPPNALKSRNFLSVNVFP